MNCLEILSLKVLDLVLAAHMPQSFSANICKLGNKFNTSALNVMILRPHTFLVASLPE